MDKIATARARMHSNGSNDGDTAGVETSLHASTGRDVSAIVGANLRRLRKSQGHSLERLAEISGVSRAMLGQIETGKSVPTVSLLWKVADALGVPVTSLVATHDAPEVVVLSRNRSEEVSFSGGRFVRRSLFVSGLVTGFGAGRAGVPEFYELRIAAHHREVAEPQAPGVHLSVVVARGALTLAVGHGDDISLSEGDAVVVEASVLHSFENLSDAEALAFIVVSQTGVKTL